jgi:hypothetical protein
MEVAVFTDIWVTRPESLATVLEDWKIYGF